MIVVMFRTEARSDLPRAEYEETNRRMHEIVRGMPGFISFKSFSWNDGERFTMVRFASREALEAWRRHPEHVKARQRGREAFYSYYKVEVLETVREYEFTPPELFRAS